MAKHKYLVSGSLFDDDDDSDGEDDSSPRFRSRIPHTVPKESGKIADLDKEKQLTQQKIHAIEHSTLASAERSINMLRETQDVGSRAAEDLATQGERLQNANKKLDEINANLKESQKHINGIKSVFHGIKNYISGKTRSPSPCRRKNTLQTQTPRIGRSTFYDATDSSQKNTKCSNALAKSLHNLDLQSSAGSSSQQVDEILEANLQEMAYQLGQLKGLGLEFGKEINHQNELIDLLQDKVERADIKIGSQNKEMNNILGK